MQKHREYIVYRGQLVGVPAGAEATTSVDVTPNMARIRAAVGGAAAGLGGGIGVVLGAQLLGPVLGPVVGGVLAGSIIGGEAGKIIAVTGAMDAVIFAGARGSV